MNGHDSGDSDYGSDIPPSQSPTSSVNLTPSVSTLPDRPHEEDGIIIQEGIPSANGSNEFELRTLAVPRIRGKVSALHGRDPVRPLDWRRTVTHQGLRQLQIKAYDAKQRISMFLQSRGEKREGKFACHHCQSNNGSFQSCVVDPNDEAKMGHGACDNCIWARRGTKCCLILKESKKHTTRTHVRSRMASGDDAIPTHAPTSSQVQVQRNTQLSGCTAPQTSKDRHPVNRIDYEKGKPERSSQIQGGRSTLLIQQFLAAPKCNSQPLQPQSRTKQPDVNNMHKPSENTDLSRLAVPAGHPAKENTLDAGESETSNWNVARHRRLPVRDSEIREDNSLRETNRPVDERLAVAALGAPCGGVLFQEDRLTSRTNIAHPALVSTFWKEQDHGTQKSITTAAVSQAGGSDINDRLQRDDLTRQDNPKAVKLSKIGENANMQGQNVTPVNKFEFFQIPANLSARSIANIDRAILELDQLRSKLTKRKQILEGAERDPFD